MSYTIAQKIDIGKTSSYIVAEELDNGNMHGGSLDEKQRILLRIVSDTIETQYNADPSDTTLTKTSEYLLRLSKFKDKAFDDLSGGSGGSVAAISTSLLISPYYFIVSAGSTPMKTGDATHTFTEFIGFNLIFTRSGVPQSQVASESTYFSWNRVTGAFVCSPALVDDELLGIIPV